MFAGFLYDQAFQQFFESEVAEEEGVMVASLRLENARRFQRISGGYPPEVYCTLLCHTVNLLYLSGCRQGTANQAAKSPGFPSCAPPRPLIDYLLRVRCRPPCRSVTYNKEKHNEFHRI